MTDQMSVCLMKRTRHRKNSKKKFWELKWFDDVQGRWRFRSIGPVSRFTKAEAEREAERLRSELNEGRIPDDRGLNMTITDLRRFDDEQIRGDAKATTIRENESAALWFSKVVGNKPITRINAADVGRLKATMRDEEKSSATIAKTLRTLRAMFNRARRIGLVRSNPFSHTKMPRTQAKEKRIYTAEEATALIQAAPDLWWRALIRLALTSGLRRGELLNLHWMDIDFENSQVSVTAKSAGRFKVDGHSQDYPVIPWEAKNYESRAVPIPEETVSILADLQLKSDGSPYVFLSLERLRRLDLVPEIKAGKPLPANRLLVNNMGRVFASIQVKARCLVAESREVGIESVEWRSGSFHDCRRTFGSNAAKAVMPHALREFMGHKDVKTTMDYYLAADRDDADRVRGQLSRLMSPV